MAMYVGLDAKLYRNTGTYASPVWNEIDTVRELTVGLEKTKAEATARLSRWRRHGVGLKAAPITMQILDDPEHDDYLTLRNAWLNDTVLDLAIATGAITASGTEYFRADYHIFSFQRGQPLEEMATIDIEADLAVTNNSPTFVLVS